MVGVISVGVALASPNNNMAGNIIQMTTIYMEEKCSVCNLWK